MALNSYSEMKRHKCNTKHKVKKNGFVSSLLANHCHYMKRSYADITDYALLILVIIKVTRNTLSKH